MFLSSFVLSLVVVQLSAATGDDNNEHHFTTVSDRCTSIAVGKMTVVVYYAVYNYHVHLLNSCDIITIAEAVAACVHVAYIVLTTFCAAS